MFNFILKAKIKKELAEFKRFKSRFEFTPKVIEDKNGVPHVDGVPLKDNNLEWVGEAETFVNVGYKIHGAMPKVLSNLFPYEFEFKGYQVGSIEAVFQAMKFKDKRLQKRMLHMHGLDSNNIKAAADYNWRTTGKLYFLGKQMDRFGSDYADFIDELYISALQNPLYRSALKNVGCKYILHAIGEMEKTETLFTRAEFEMELNALKEFVKLKNT